MTAVDRRPGMSRHARSRQRVLDAVRREGSATRADVQRLTGLSRSAVADVVADLLASERLLEQRPPGPSVARGRPAGVLVAVDRLGHVGGIDIGHAHVAVAVADTTGEVGAERRVAVDVDRCPDDAFTAACELLDACCDATRVEPQALMAVAVGVPGPIGATSDAIRSSSILPGWVDLHPARELGRRLGRPVLLGNDADLGARGEVRYGAARGLRDVVYVKASHGIGAGLVLDGRSYRGTVGIAGEIGHSRVPGARARCRCGARGCLETVASIDAVYARLDRGAAPDLGGAAARSVLAEAGHALGVVLAGLCNCLNPQAVVIGGELGAAGAAGDAVIAAVRTAIDTEAMPAVARAVTVLPAQLGARAELLGAVWWAIEQAQRAA